MKHLLFLLLLSSTAMGCSTAAIRKTFKWTVPTFQAWDCKQTAIDVQDPLEHHEVFVCYKQEWEMK